MPDVMEAATQMELPTEAVALLATGMAPRAAVQALLDAGRQADALRLLARLLPARYAVAWLCQCARGEPLSKDDRLGASLAEKWLRDASEASRRVAYDFACNDGFKSLGAWIALAAGWTGGSLAPASQEQAVPPPAHLPAVAVAAAVTMLAALEAARLEERRAGFVDQAMGLLDQGAPVAPAGGSRAGPPQEG